MADVPAPTGLLTCPPCPSLSSEAEVALARRLRRLWSTVDAVDDGDHALGPPDVEFLPDEYEDDREDER